MPTSSFSPMDLSKVVEGEPKYTSKSPISDYLEQIGVARAAFLLEPTLPAPELFEVRQHNSALVLGVLQVFGRRSFAEKDADFSSLLGGDYFSDRP